MTLYVEQKIDGSKLQWVYVNGDQLNPVRFSSLNVGATDKRATLQVVDHETDKLTWRVSRSRAFSLVMALSAVSLGGLFTPKQDVMTISGLSRMVGRGMVERLAGKTVQIGLTGDNTVWVNDVDGYHVIDAGERYPFEEGAVYHAPNPFR